MLMSVMSDAVSELQAWVDLVRDVAAGKSLPRQGSPSEVPSDTLGMFHQDLAPSFEGNPECSPGQPG